MELLFTLQRYADCSKYCEVLAKADKSSYDKMKVQLYGAMCKFQVYNREIMEKVEKQYFMAAFEYKNMMQSFCKDQVLQVIKTLAYVKQNARKHSSENCEFKELMSSEAEYMLDKALLDCLIFNIEKVSICLLCHCKTKKLVHSHYIPKSILQEFVKLLGVDHAESIFLFTPTQYPTNWQLKSAGKITFSMLCKECDGVILNKDENWFKNNVFSKIYLPNSPGSFLGEHLISYNEHLYRFAAGLLFRNIATCYSKVYAEIGDVKKLYSIMQWCREVTLGLPNMRERPKIYMLALPFELPSSLPQIYGWDKFVWMANSQYAAYKLLRYEELCCLLWGWILILRMN